MNVATHERLHIAIIGAGIGGLTLSVALGFMKDQHDLEIDIYEASSHISEIGAGINFWPRTWDIMNSIGLREKLLRCLPRAPDDSPRIVFEVRKGDQADGFHVQDIIMKGGPIRFHRADLQQALLSSSSGCLHLSHRLVSYEENAEEIRLQFEDGTTATCDMLIGMDGIKSMVRKCFLISQGLPNSPSLNPIWSGDTAYRALIPIETLEAVFPGHHAITTPMMYIGKSKHIITYPISNNKLVNLVAICTDYSKEGIIYDGPTTACCSHDEVLSNFQGWEHEVQALLQCIQTPTKWILGALKPLDRYSLGRVVLAGDAAHAMTPHQGAGAGQAIEDAYVLAALISDRFCTRDTTSTISEVYNTIRCPMVNLVVEKSRMAGRLCQLMAPGFEDVVEGDTEVPFERVVGAVQDFSDSLEWVWKESAEVDRQRALGMLRSLEAV